MDFRKFHRMTAGKVRNALHVRPSTQAHFPDPFALHRGEILPSATLVFERVMGSVPTDLVGTSSVVPYLLSSRAVELLAIERFTGWTSHAVEVHGKRGVIEGYHVLVVTGQCGSIDNSLSQQVMRDAPTPSGNPYPAYVGLYFRPETWDGSDIFCPATSGFVIVTEKVKEAIEGSKLANFYFERLTEVERLIPSWKR